jgi:hypothetical protein
MFGCGDDHHHVFMKKTLHQVGYMALTWHNKWVGGPNNYFSTYYLPTVQCLLHDEYHRAEEERVFWCTIHILGDTSKASCEGHHLHLLGLDMKNISCKRLRRRLVWGIIIVTLWQKKDLFTARYHSSTYGALLRSRIVGIINLFEWLHILLSIFVSLLMVSRKS